MMGIREFGRGVDECTAAKIRRHEPLPKGNEQAGEPVTGFRGVLLHRGGKPGTESFVSTPQIGCDELVLGFEVRIECHLRDAGFGDDSIDPNRSDPIAIKEPVRRFQDAFACGNRLVLTAHTPPLRLTVYSAKTISNTPTGQRVPTHRVQASAVHTYASRPRRAESGTFRNHYK